MTEENIKMLINEYLDGEIDKSAEKDLFISLSENENLRQYFSNMITLKKSIKLTEESVPFSIERNILNKITQKSESNNVHNNNYKFAFALGFALCLLLISIYLFNRNIEINNQIHQAFNKINEQDKKLEIILNSVPSAEIKPVYYKEIIINSN
jgi:hypothetical protein